MTNIELKESSFKDRDKLEILNPIPLVDYYAHDLFNMSFAWWPFAQQVQENAVNSETMMLWLFHTNSF